MDEFRNNFNDENENYEKQENDINYNFLENDTEPAMSGTVSEKHALSVYRPKIKKNPFKNPVFAAVVSAVVTSIICFSVFAGVGALINSGRTNEPSSLTIANQENDGVKNVVNNLSGTKLSVPDIYDKVSPSVVSIICTTKGNALQTGAKSSGSGVILTKDGYIVTNNHVIEGAAIITVKTIAGQSLTAQLVGADAKTDIAVLKVNCNKELPFAEIGNSAALRVGDMAVAIGNPLQEELVSTLTVGYISAIDRTMVIDQRQMTMIQTDAAINPGNSGGALINEYGQVIGITTAKQTGYDIEGLGFAIPSNEAVPIIESIIEHGYVTGRPLVGITGINVTEAIAEANDLPIGVYVDTVISGGAADLGSIVSGDVILKFDGKDIKSVDEINAIRDEHKVGDKIAVTVWRNGKKVNCTIILQEEKPTEETKIQEQSQQNQEESPNGRFPSYGFPSDFFSFFGW